MEQNQEKNSLSNLKPKTAFKVGLFSGIAAMFIIGFFILLGIMINDKTKDKTNNENTNDNPTVVNNNQGATPTNIQLQAVDKDKDWIRGDKNAKVSIVEFSDIDCPFCTRHHDTMNQLMEKYDGKINWVYRHFPLTSLHPDAFKKAEAAECVGELGGNDKFWEYLDKLFADDETAAELGDIASSIGINKDKFQNCLDAGKYTSKIQNHSSQAQAAGGRGTPYSIIVSGDQKTPINGALPIATIEATLEGLLK
jgi:protein-disulfide isomerase